DIRTTKFEDANQSKWGHQAKLFNIKYASKGILNCITTKQSNDIRERRHHIYWNTCGSHVKQARCNIFEGWRQDRNGDRKSWQTAKYCKICLEHNFYIL